ncbi:putative plastid-lipid-associated protein 8, chloroplastic [Glycine max]|nr:probable plastid-lipid-associated protein 8, chloroplastic isoform X2 [Glycine max]XP_028211372.1 probable plastid-lipid-associated protein 8, chloroplastic isoform X2 [Glycine soja]KAH1203227.1 putative plastid-lipid-associated protein 8, chloroplastic [Glycine max]RZB57767.1 putative plastid-lipid-associated protein 8, chloroplastic isoform B [Glycine soja]|eukprot:XP_003550148.2 probable plastid-lipid-associated protein 8, chloroplastic isoform X2 [Glycine max]
MLRLCGFAMAATASASAASLSLRSSPFKLNPPKLNSVTLRFPHLNRRYNSAFRVVAASVSVSNPNVQTGPDDLVASILSKVVQTDGGVLLKEEEHKEVAEVAQELQKYCVSEPVKCPLIFGEWDVAYCSRPTSPGGGYRSAIGRLFFNTKQMVQVVEAPDIVRNKVSLSVLSFLDVEVSLQGKLKALDGEWIQVIFEAPELKVGSWQVQYGGQSEVKLRITYVDEKISGKNNSFWGVPL